MDYTIQHSTVIDGTGAARFAADVLIRDGRIAEVAPHVPPVGEVIDARGMIVCPGFIDMHTHSQLVVFTEPDLPMKAAQGITTELFGQERHGDLSDGATGVCHVAHAPLWTRLQPAH